MRKKRLLRLCAALLALALASGCAPAPESQSGQALESGTLESTPADAKSDGVLRLAYDDTSTLNPYTTKALQNYYISRLLYDPLVQLDAEYEPHNCLAQSVSVALDQAGTAASGDTAVPSSSQAVYTVRLRPDLRFWDGSGMTAQDVAYSLKQAMASSYYAAGLSHVQQVTVDKEDPLKLVIRLSRADAFFDRSLTFPVVKDGTGGDDRPVGSGRFKPQSAKVLVPNPNSITTVATFKSIQLVQLNDMDSMSYSIKTGIVDMAYSDLRSTWNKSLGNGFTSVQLNNMVYLGVNKTNGALANAEVRKVLYRLVDRDQVINNAYMGLDAPTWLPFNPEVKAVKNAIALPSQMTDKMASAQLDDLGYADRDSSGYRVKNGRRLSFTILVNSDNSNRVEVAKSVAQFCESVGIQATVKESTFDDYKTSVASGNYDLFVGEVKVPLNMDVLPMLEGRGETGSGAMASAGLQTAARTFLQTGNDYGKAAQLFVDEIPFIPLFFRRGIVTYPLNFCSNIIATEQDIFYNIDQWKVS